MRQQQAEMPRQERQRAFGDDGEVTFTRVSWICANDRYQLLFYRSPKRKALYHPGGKPLPDMSEKEYLAKKIAHDFGVALVPDTIQFFFSYRAATDQNESVIMEDRCYRAEFVGQLRPTAFATKLHFLGTGGKWRTTIAGRSFIDSCFSRGITY